MGNMRSGRWRKYRKKSVVEDACILDIQQWTRNNILSPGIHRLDTLTSFCVLQDIPSMTAEVNTLDITSPWIRLSYRIPDTRELIMAQIPLLTTSPYFGGQRWWFSCPLVVNYTLCNRRVRKLYLPPGARYFSCRVCAGLTYRSCQQSHSRYAGYDPEYRALLERWQPVNASQHQRHPVIAVRYS
jgi:hypothetical protein